MPGSEGEGEGDEDFEAWLGIEAPNQRFSAQRRTPHLYQCVSVSVCHDSHQRVQWYGLQLVCSG